MLSVYDMILSTPRFPFPPMKHQFTRLVLLFSCIAQSFLSGSADAATTITLRPDSTTPTDGDAFVTTGPSNNLTGNNYGSAGALGVTAALAKGAFSSVLRFDLSTLTIGFDTAFGVGMWTIDSVSLELTTASPNNPIFNSPNTAGNFSINWFSNDVWTEGTGTPASSSTSGVVWSSIALLTSGSQSLGTFTYDASGTDQYNLNPSSGLLTDIYAGSLASFWLIAADNQVSALFNSRNNGVMANRPGLIVTASAVPEPDRAILLATALFSLSMRRRKGIPDEIS